MAAFCASFGSAIQPVIKIEDALALLSVLEVRAHRLEQRVDRDDEPVLQLCLAQSFCERKASRTLLEVV